jgi:hypothetical protein
MEFFDRKEDVIDIELTQYGKHLLSLGKFKPAEYAFYDDDVLYDVKYSAISDEDNVDSTQRTTIEEDQNKTKERIKETPRLIAQHNFSDREGRTGTSQADYHTDCGPYVIPDMLAEALIEKVMNLSPEIALDMDIDTGDINSLRTIMSGEHLGGTSGQIMASALEALIYESGKTNNYGIYSSARSLADCYYQKSLSELQYYPYIFPLGNSSMGTTFAPAWSVKFLNGELLTKDPYDSVPFYSGSNFPPTMRIPQLETKIEYETYVTYKNNDGTYVENYAQDDVGFLNQLDSPEFRDKSIIQVKSDYTLLDLSEINTDFLKENFEMEVFVVNEEDNKQSAYVWFIMGKPTGISNGDSLKLVAAEGNEYLAVVDTSVTAADSTSTVIGTSGVTTAAQLATSIYNSLTASELFDIPQPILNKFYLYQKSIGKKGNTKIEGSLIDKGYVLPQDKINNGDTSPSATSSRKLKYFVGGTDDVSREYKQMFFFNPDVDTEIKKYHIDYWFEIKTDEEIESKFYCKAKNVDKKQNILSDQQIPFNCDDASKSKDQNIYKIEITQEDFEEPC